MVGDLPANYTEQGVSVRIGTESVTIGQVDAPRKRSRKGLWSMVILLLVAVGGGGYWVYNNGIGKKTNDTVAVTPAAEPGEPPNKAVNDQTAAGAGKAAALKPAAQTGSTETGTEVPGTTLAQPSALPGQTRPQAAPIDPTQAQAEAIAKRQQATKATPAQDAASTQAIQPSLPGAQDSKAGTTVVTTKAAGTTTTAAATPQATTTGLMPAGTGQWSPLRPPVKPISPQDPANSATSFFDEKWRRNATATPPPRAINRSAGTHVKKKVKSTTAYIKPKPSTYTKPKPRPRSAARTTKPKPASSGWGGRVLGAHRTN